MTDRLFVTAEYGYYTYAYTYAYYGYYYAEVI